MTIYWLNQKNFCSLDSDFDVYAFMSGNAIKRVIIAMHGYGDNAKNFSELVKGLHSSDTLWLFIQAPKPVPSLSDGYQWFNLFDSHEIEASKSLNGILNLYSSVQENCKILDENIFFLGFSQGASMALLAGLLLGKKMGGIIALSGFLVNLSNILKKQSEINLDTPIFLAHGKSDQVVIPSLHFECRSILQHLGIRNILTKIYPIGHNISQEEMNHIKKFIEGSNF